MILRSGAGVIRGAVMAFMDIGKLKVDLRENIQDLPRFSNFTSKNTSHRN